MRRHGETCQWIGWCTQPVAGAVEDDDRGKVPACVYCLKAANPVPAAKEAA